MVEYVGAIHFLLCTYSAISHSLLPDEQASKFSTSCQAATRLPIALSNNIQSQEVLKPVFAVLAYTSPTSEV
jgi:hypothetical protein